MSTIHLKIITPTKVVKEEDVNSVTIATSEGEITVLPHHAHLFSLLKEGIIKIKKNNEEEFLAIGGGYLETDGEELSVLVSRAYGQHEIDEKITQKAMEEAKKILTEIKDENQREQAIATLRRSVVDLKLLKKRKRPVG